MKHLFILLSLSLVTAAFSQTVEPGKNFTTSQGISMVWSENCWIGEKEVTQGQFTALGFKDGSTWKKGEKNAPANNVSWPDALKFCVALQGTEAARIPAGAKYLLPTVVQWRNAKHGAVKDLDGGVSEWCIDKFTPLMAQGNREAGVANAYVFMPAATAGLYCVLGTSWKSTSADFAKGICPLAPVARAVEKGRPGTAAGGRLTEGEIGFRVALVPAVAK